MYFTETKLLKHSCSQCLEDSGYPHDSRADKNPYPHDRRADKDFYLHDSNNQCIILRLQGHWSFRPITKSAHNQNRSMTILAHTISAHKHFGPQF